MSFSVGAALKKLLVMTLTDRETLKKAGMVIVIMLLVIFLPMAAVTVIFSQTVNVDSDKLTEIVISNMSEEERQMFEDIQNTMTDLESRMTAAGFASRIKEAQVLYIFALYDYSKEPEFTARLVGCFAPDQSDDSLIAAVNSEFRTLFTTDQFVKLMASVNAVAIETYDYKSPETKNSTDLAAWAVHAWKSCWGYVWGSYGEVLSKSDLSFKLSQYPEEVGAYREFIEENWLGRRCADCVGLIKGYGWLDVQTKEVVYGSNGMPDVSANDMFVNAAEKGGIATMPEIVGLAVWQQGHIGIYIGDGFVIEARGTEYGVVRTRLVSGGWTHWLKIPYISYEEIPESGGEVIIQY